MKIFNLNNKGMGKKEMMLVLLILLAGITYGLYKIIGNNAITQMANFKRLAATFIDEAGRLRDNEIHYEERVYLYDTIELDYLDELKNPFNHQETCDKYESKIEMADNKVYITFKCGEYYIFDQQTTEEYTVYKVSEWTDQKLTGENVQTANFYNYTVNDVEILDKYYIEKEFLVEYAQKSGFKTLTIGNLNPNHKLVKKTYYRTLEQVK